MKVRRAGIALAIALISGCHIDDGTTDAIPAVSSPSSEPTVHAEVDLPFDNPMPNRWNPSNDGTPFEPCLAYSDDELLSFGLDPKVIKDAAQVDGQGIRGCVWFMPDTYSLSVVVTNSLSLGEYRAGKPELHWRPDLVLLGRSVGVGELRGINRTCSTYVQSAQSIVATTITITGGSEAREKYDPCRIAIDFTTEYLDKIPE